MGVKLKTLDAQANTLKLSRLTRPEGASDMNMSNFAEGAHSTPHGTVRRLVDASSIAKSFGMSPTWFLTRAREKRIPHVRMGKYVRFDPEDVRAFFARQADRHANS